MLFFNSGASPLRGRVVLLAVVLTLLALLSLTITPERWELAIERSMAATGGWAPLIMLSTYIVAVLLLSPLSPFALACGLLFDFWLGALLALASINGGAILAFLLTRHLLQNQMQSLLLRNEKARRALNTVCSDDVRIIALLRIHPLVPFSLQNYVYGLTPTPLLRYSLGTAIGSAPLTLVLVYLGHAGRSSLFEGDEANVAVIAMVVVGAAATLLLSVLYLNNLKKQSQVKEARQ